MKCYFCSRQLEIITQSYDGNFIECPSMHMGAYIKSNNVASYWFIWDEDDKGKKRYKMFSNCKRTTVIRYEYPQLHREQTVLDFQNYIPIEIKNDIINLDYVVNKIKKLIYFL